MVDQRIEEIQALTAPIQGWLNPEAGAAMYNFVRNHAEGGVVVEIGSWKGLSTVWLGCGVKDRGHGRVYCVDTWQGSDEPEHTRLLQGYGENQLYDEFMANMENVGLSDFIVPIKMTSLEAAGKWEEGPSIGFLHIDAGHEYKYVREDFEIWSPFVKPGGFVVFDDVPNWPGPTQVVWELPRWYRWVGIAPNKWIVQKLP